MTVLELAVLRDRVVRATIRREQIRRDSRSPWPLIPRRARCVYCAHRIGARHKIACSKHLPLLALDDKYVDLAWKAAA